MLIKVSNKPRIFRKPSDRFMMVNGRPVRFTRDGRKGRPLPF